MTALSRHFFDPNYQLTSSAGAFAIAILLTILLTEILGFARVGVVAAVGNDATFVSRAIPTQMRADETAHISITVQNTGGTTWTVESLYRLGAGCLKTGNPHNNGFGWSNFASGGYSNNVLDQRAFLSKTVAPGYTVTFAFDITAPPSAGTYWFEARMVQDGVAWFGGSFSEQITVVTTTTPDDAVFVSYAIPTSMNAGERKTVVITVRNTGYKTWAGSGEVNPYRVGAGSISTGNLHKNEFTWSNWEYGGYINNILDQRAFLGGTMGTNQEATVHFDITAPSSPGTYWFEARMVHDGVRWFGATLSVAITVEEKPPSTVTLTLYIHDGSVSGPVLSGARVAGQDGAGNPFDETTNTNGCVVIVGYTGSWQFTASKIGYQTSSWSQSINEIYTEHAYLLKTSVKANGIDVSHWQGAINWDLVHSAGCEFAFVKASEGVTYNDPNFETNMLEGRAAGMLLGAYHFARPNYGNDATDEALYFVSVAGEYITEGYLRPVLDLEVGSNLGKVALSNWVHEWMSTVESETGVEPIIYVNSNYANHYLDASIAQYDLWIAHWTYDAELTPNTGIWGSWAFWQYSNQGSVPGIAGRVDLDVFNGGTSELNNYRIGGA